MFVSGLKALRMEAWKSQEFGDFDFKPTGSYRLLVKLSIFSSKKKTKNICTFVCLDIILVLKLVVHRYMCQYTYTSAKWAYSNANGIGHNFLGVNLNSHLRHVVVD